MSHTVANATARLVASTFVGSRISTFDIVVNRRLEFIAIGVAVVFTITEASVWHSIDVCGLTTQLCERIFSFRRIPSARFANTHDASTTTITNSPNSMQFEIDSLNKRCVKRNTPLSGVILLARAIQTDAKVRLFSCVYFDAQGNIFVCLVVVCCFAVFCRARPLWRLQRLPRSPSKFVCDCFRCKQNEIRENAHFWHRLQQTRRVNSHCGQSKQRANTTAPG
jgi:hypothetical protein